MNWSLSGQFGGGRLTSVSTDTEVKGLVSRTGTSTVHLDGYDSAHFENTVNLTHLQGLNRIIASVDENGNFTFDNMELFGLHDGMNSVRVTPNAKDNVTLNPQSVIVYTSR